MGNEFNRFIARISKEQLVGRLPSDLAFC
jgi:hypothetical protein